MSTSKAIVVVTTSFPIRGDGSEAAGSFVSDLVEELARQVPVRVVAPGEAVGRTHWMENVEVLRFGGPDKPLSTLKPWVPSGLVSLRQVMVGGLKATREAVLDGPTSQILALWALPSGYWARRVSRECSVPYSVWTLGSDIWSLGRVPFVRGQLRTVLRDARHCYSDGFKLADDTRDIGRRDVAFLPSTRRIERRRERSSRPVPPYRLLFLGRWHPNKGIDLLLEALSTLRDRDWQRIEGVDIYGGGPMAALVKSGVEALRAAGRPVVVHGFLDKPAAEQAILDTDYLLIPSRIESIPVVFSDAMKLGCPVVSMPTGDLPRLVAADPACGVIASAITSVAYAAALSQALGCSAQTFDAGTYARAAEFDLADVANRILIDGQIANA